MMRSLHILESVHFFTGCIRGFSGVDNMDQPTRSDLLSFNTSVGVSHTGGTKVHNLSNLFIREFFNKP